jgi:hypothetical protein
MQTTLHALYNCAFGRPLLPRSRPLPRVMPQVYRPHVCVPPTHTPTWPPIEPLPWRSDSSALHTKCFTLSLISSFMSLVTPGTSTITIPTILSQACSSATCGSHVLSVPKTNSWKICPISSLSNWTTVDSAIVKALPSAPMACLTRTNNE